MCTIQIKFKESGGAEQTFTRTVETEGGGDAGAVSDLAALRRHMGELQTNVNAAITVVVDREKAANSTSGKPQNSTEQDEEDDEEDDDDDDEDNSEANGCPEPPEKLRKTS